MRALVAARPRWVALLAAALLTGCSGIESPDPFGDLLPPAALSRLGALALRHLSPCQAIAFSPDGRALASAGADGRVALWDPDSGKRLALLDDPWVRDVADLAWLPGGNILAACGRRGEIQLWDPVTSEPLRELREATVKAVTFPGGSAPPQEPDAEYDTLAVSPDGSLLAAGDGWRVVLWELPAGRVLGQAPTLEGRVHALAFCADGRRLAAAGSADGIAVWRIRGGAGRPDAVWAASGPVGELAFDRQGRWLAARENRRITLRHADTGAILRAWPCSAGGGLAFSADGALLAWADGGRIRLTDPASGRLARDFPEQPKPLETLAFSPDGRTLATVAAGEQAMRLWSLDGTERLRFPGHRAAVRWLGSLPGGRRLRSASGDGSVRTWELASGREERALQMSSGRETRSVAMSPDGRWLAVHVHREAVTLLDAGTSRLERPLDSGTPRWVGRLAFSPDGALVAIGANDIPLPAQLVVCEAASGRRRLTLEHPNVVNDVAFSPDGRRLASACGDGRARVWDSTSGRRIAEWDGRAGPLCAVAWSPDGRWLGVHGTERAGLWDASTGECRATLDLRGEALPWHVPCLAFSPDGAWLVTGGHNDGIVWWSVPGCRKGLCLPEGRDGRAHCLAFLPDGRLLAGMQAGTILTFRGALLTREPRGP